MNKEIKNADIEKITVDYATKVRETEEEFIFQTITPFCFNILLKIISKKELKDTLLRGQRLKWIPCSERLPEKYMKVLATWKDTWYQNAAESIDTLFLDEDGKWHGRFGNLERNGSVEVIAWKPLPEPYRGE